MPSIKKVRNWNEYNKSLEKRGEIIFVIAEEYYEKLYFQGEQKRGGAVLYNKEMYEFIMTIKATFRLALRQSVGCARGILRRMFGASLVPNYGHVSRKVKELEFEIKRYTDVKDRLVICFDSTGVSIHSVSGWHQRKHGGKKLDANERWRKIHIMMDLNSGQILDLKITGSTVNDCTIVKEAMEGFIEKEERDGNLEALVGDGAYDTYEIYKIGHELGMKVLIPPARTSKAQHELSKKPERLKEHLRQRDDTIDFIRKFDNFDAGLKEWKKKSGYHVRSKVEATIFRLKKSFGFYLQFKESNSRFNEMKVKINLLNRMLLCGRASYVT